MSKAHTNGIDLYYEIHGNGTPVVLIGGLGADTFLWFRQTPELCKDLQVIVFDTHGSDQSASPNL